MRAPKLLVQVLLVAITAICASTVFGQGMAQGSKDPAVLKRLAKGWEEAQAAFGRKPHDPKVRGRYVEAGTLYGHESMVSPLLPPKIKYRQAVLVYRKVLQVDPKTEPARQEYDLMISIYRQMHRPIPQ